MYSYLTERKNSSRTVSSGEPIRKPGSGDVCFNYMSFVGVCILKTKQKTSHFEVFYCENFACIFMWFCVAFVAVWEPSENCSGILPSSSAYHQNTCFLVGDVLEALCAFFCYLDKQMPLKTQCQQTCLWGGLWFQTHFERDKTRGKLPDSFRDH